MTQLFCFHIYVHSCENLSYLMFNFPKLCCWFYESPPSISPAFALLFCFSPTPYIVLEEGVTFRQGEENTLPTNIGTEANKSQDRKERRAYREQMGVTLGLGKSSKNNKAGLWNIHLSEKTYWHYLCGFNIWEARRNCSVLLVFTSVTLRNSHHNI